MKRVMPIKFKGPDLSATSTQVAIEELHLVCDELKLERGTAGAVAPTGGGAS